MKQTMRMFGMLYRPATLVHNSVYEPENKSIFNCINVWERERKQSYLKSNFKDIAFFFFFNFTVLS